MTLEPTLKPRNHETHEEKGCRMHHIHFLRFRVFVAIYPGTMI